MNIENHFNLLLKKYHIKLYCLFFISNFSINTLVIKK